jgi:hypothetical protein
MPYLYVVGGEQEPHGPGGAGSVLERFDLVTRDGDSLGGVGLARPDWPIGMTIDRDGERLRVVEIIQPESHGEPRILVVEPV